VTAMLRAVPAPPELTNTGTMVPAVVVRAALATCGVVLSYVLFGPTGWLALGIMASVAAAWSPRHLLGWALILLLAAGQLAHHPGLTWRFLVLLAGLHLLHLLSMLALELPWRAWVQLAVFRAPLRRYVAIQVPTQLLAVAALLWLAPRHGGHRPITVTAFAALGAVAFVGLALLLSSHRHDPEAEDPRK